ncbi:MAG TPA: BRO family protein [Spirochaetia bacterium]|nr:BRO family protein [Spirochaetia bacterium]
MDKIFGLYNHEHFGTLRTLVTEGVVLFCANDVAEALDFCDPRGAVKYHCKNIEKHRHYTNGGVQTMNFTDIDDVMRLVASSKIGNSEDFGDWLIRDVIPHALTEAGIDPQNGYDMDEECLIRKDDYISRLYLETALYSTLDCLVRGIRELPDNRNTHLLKLFSERSIELVDDVFFGSGITREFVADSNIDHISDLLENVLLSPEDAGYVKLDELDEDDGYYDDDEYFEYDDEDEASDTDDISAILDCCKRMLAIAGAQLSRLEAE